jgi:hypothetical protein
MTTCGRNHTAATIDEVVAQANPTRNAILPVQKTAEDRVKIENGDDRLREKKG